MAWATIKATGSGSLAWRLMIPGHPYEGVSTSALIGAGTDGRLRLDGLDSAPIMWSERLDPAMCELTANGFTAAIVEDGAHRWGDSFTVQPETVYYLAATMTVGTTTMTLTASGPADGAVLFVGQECVLITSGGGTASLTVTRAYRDTVAAAHYVDATIGLPLPEVTTSMPSIKGMLAFLYAYGDGETGDGTLVWTGIVGSEPKLRGLTTWEISLGSVMGILEQALSADLQEPVPLRGIYYIDSTAPSFTLEMKATALSTGATQDRAEVDRTALSGFYETQEEFCAAVNAAIQTATAGWTAGSELNRSAGQLPTLIAAPTSDGSWGLTYSTPAASPLWLEVNTIGSPLDPFFFSPFALIKDDGTTVDTVATSTAYRVPLFGEERRPGLGTVPRGFIGSQARGFGDALDVYVGGTATIAAADGLLIQWPAFDGKPELAVGYYVNAWDAATRKATVAAHRLASAPGPTDRYYTAQSVPTLQVTRYYVAEGTGGNFADFLAALTTGAATESGLGRQPNVTTEHIDVATTTTNVDAVTSGRAWLTQRGYAGTSDVVLLELLAAEARLTGMVPAIGADGRVLWVEFRVGASTENAAYEVTADTNLSSRQLPGYEPSAFGLVNTIMLRTGFDPVSGDHNGDLFALKDARALARQPVPFVMDIEPRSSFIAGDRAIPVSDVVAMAQAWFGVLGAAYAVVTVTCPLSAIDAIIGTQCSLTISQLPNSDGGGRGITTQPGVVVGRDVKPMMGTVELTVLTTQVRVAGYAPSALVDSAGLVSGNTWDFAIDTSEYFASGQAVSDCFAAGYAVRMTQRYVAAPTELAGTVVSVTGNDIRVTFTGAFTSRADDVLEFDVAANATTAQQAWCFIAGDDDFIGFASLANARQFAS